MHGMFLKNIKYREIIDLCVYFKVGVIFSICEVNDVSDP